MTMNLETPPVAPGPAAKRPGLRLPPRLIAAIAPIQWGCNPLIVTELAVPGRPLLVGLLSTLPVGLLMTATSRSRPSGVWWGRYVVLALCNYAISTPLFYFGMQHMPGGVATLLIATQPLFAMLLSLPLLGVRPTPAQLLSLAVGLVGVGLVVLKGAEPLNLVAAGLLLLSATTAALGIVLTKRWSPPDPVIRHNGWQLLIAGLVLLPLTLLSEGFPTHFTWKNILAFALIGFVSKLLGFSLWFRSIPKVGATSVALLVLLVPTTAFILGFLLKGQTVTVQQAFGVALVIFAVVVGGKRGKAKTG